MSIKNYFQNLFEVPETADENENEVKEEPKRMERTYTENTVKEAAAPKNNYAPAADPSNALELKVVRPENASSLQQIATYVINRCTVVLNLEATDRDLSRRILDYLQGVAFAVEAQIKVVANNTYVITPNTVSVTDEIETTSKKTETSAFTSGDEF